MARQQFTETELTTIATRFTINNIHHIQPWGNGHINQTYRVNTATGTYILQRINTDIFHNVPALMRNIELITTHLATKGRETLTLIPLREGGYLLQHPTHGSFRMYKYITNTTTHNTITNPTTAYAAGKAFGQFQQDLADFNAHDLTETIPHFHHTPTRLTHLKNAITTDIAGRVKTAQPEINTLLTHETDYTTITNALQTNQIPQRVTHNDTKINNILFDATTGKTRAIIDLDTVMPGSLLYDFGDAIRTATATTTEDDPNPTKMKINLKLYQAYCQGFLHTTHHTITKHETELLPFSTKILTLECAIRFLTDYLNGDTYFKTTTPNHNLIRTRTQLALANNIQQNMHTINTITHDALTKARTR